jgi:hypothetical protein
MGSTRKWGAVSTVMVWLRPPASTRPSIAEIWRMMMFAVTAMATSR